MCCSLCIESGKYLKGSTPFTTSIVCRNDHAIRDRVWFAVVPIHPIEDVHRCFPLPTWKLKTHEIWNPSLRLTNRSSPQSSVIMFKTCHTQKRTVPRMHRLSMSLRTPGMNYWLKFWTFGTVQNLSICWHQIQVYIVNQALVLVSMSLALALVSITLGCVMQKTSEEYLVRMQQWGHCKWRC